MRPTEKGSGRETSDEVTSRDVLAEVREPEMKEGRLTFALWFEIHCEGIRIQKLTNESGLCVCW